MLTLHDWHPALNQCCGFRHVNTGGTGGWRGGVPKEQAAVYFGSFCLTQLRCECMPTVPAAPRWCAFFEKWDNSFIDMEMWCSQNNGGLFYTLRQGENELHSEQDLPVQYGEWKDGFRLTCNNSPGLPRDSARHLSVTLADIVRVTASICQTIPEQNRQITFLAGWLSRHLHLFQNRCMLRDKLSMEPSSLVAVTMKA